MTALSAALQQAHPKLFMKLHAQHKMCRCSSSIGMLALGFHAQSVLGIKLLHLHHTLVNVNVQHTEHCHNHSLCKAKMQILMACYYDGFCFCNRVRLVVPPRMCCWASLGLRMPAVQATAGSYLALWCWLHVREIPRQQRQYALRSGLSWPAAALE